MQAPMAPAAPSLTSGTGQLRDLAQERYLAEGNGVGFGDPGSEYGGPGPTGAPSTGNFGQDVMNFGRNAGPAVAGLLGGPVGLMGVVGGTMLGGALRGLGYEQTANALIGNVIGVQGLDGGPGATTSEGMGLGATDAPSDTSGMGFGGDYSNGFAGLGAEPGLAGIAGDAGAPSSDVSGAGFDGSYGGEQGFGGYGDFGGFGGYGGDNGGTCNASSSDGGFGGESAGGGLGSSWRYGGYTGHGENGMIDPDAEAGTVHEGEYVLRHEATQHYGQDIMHALNSGMIPRNALAALAMQRRPQAANHLLQMMMR